MQSISVETPNRVTFNIIFILVGSSLAQDRGRLEAKIEALTAEVASLKKQQVADNEGLKIKTKVIDDQTDTIRKLKEVKNASCLKYYWNIKWNNVENMFY